MKTGCLTCRWVNSSLAVVLKLLIDIQSFYRIRRIKCDEEKPACLKCTYTGRKCDGYVISSRPLAVDHNGDPQLSVGMALGVPLTDQDSHHFHYFRQRSAQDLASFLEAETWNNYILRLASSVPAIRRAVVAFASLHESYLVGKDEFAVPSAFHAPMVTDSLKLYNNAIRTLNDQLDIASSDDGMVETTLVSCFLFICFEVLRGNYVAALKHLEGGLNVLHGMFDPSSKALLGPAANGQDSSLLMLKTLYKRLDIQASSYVEARPLRSYIVPTADTFPQTPLTVSLSLASCFTTIIAARDALNDIIGHAYCYFQSTARGCKYIPWSTTSAFHGPNDDTALHGRVVSAQIPAHAIQERDVLLEILGSWARSFAELLEKTSSRAVEHDTTATKGTEARECAVIWLNYLITFIKLSTCLDPEQLSYDNHLLKFRSIIEQAEAVLFGTGTIGSTNITDGSRKRFTAEMNVIHPLYVTAMKCRATSIRQRAINLLRVSGKEGTWDGEVMAKIAEHVISIENEGRVSGGLGEEEPDFGIPEYQRVHGATLNIDQDSGKVWVECSRMIPSSDPDKAKWSMHGEMLFL